MTNTILTLLLIPLIAAAVAAVLKVVQAAASEGDQDRGDFSGVRLVVAVGLLLFFSRMRGQG